MKSVLRLTWLFTNNLFGYENHEIYKNTLNVQVVVGG